MKTAWFKGLTKEDVKKLEEEFKASSLMRRQLTQILSDKIDVAGREVRSKRSYELPSWREYQADFIGYERALRELIDIFSEK